MGYRWEDNREDRALKLSKLRKKGARGPEKCYKEKRTQAPSRLDNENGQMQSLEDFYNAEPSLTSSNRQHSIYKFHIPSNHKNYAFTDACVKMFFLSHSI